MNMKLTAKQLAKIKQAARPKSRPKSFTIDWIPEAAGRELVRMFAMIIYAYRDQSGKRIENMTMAYATDGARIQFTLCVEPEAGCVLDEEERPDERLHPPPNQERE